jgi:hypothetical protein
MIRLVAGLLLLLALAGLSPARAFSSCPDTYTAGAICAPVSGNATGSTGAVVGTLPASTAGKTTFICGFSVDAVGGTAAVGPIVLSGIIGGPMTFQLSSSATGSFRDRDFSPCLAASAANTAITVTTTANATATAVDVKTWGYQQ